MDREQTMADITKALEMVLGRDLGTVTEQTRLFEDLHLDSTSVIELLIVIESIVGITVDVYELDPDVFTTVGALTDYVGLARAGAR